MLEFVRVSMAMDFCLTPLASKSLTMATVLARVLAR